ncbi:MAG: ABC transporter ATP-binding protein [Pseudomonadota bacterium]
MPDASPAIETRALQKIYYSGFWRRPFTGLDGLDLRVPRGEIFGFIGPNGAGKTTAIKCLVGLQSPTAGAAFLLGRPAHETEARRRLGYLPERPYFYQHLTAAEFLDFYGQLFDIPREVRRARVGALLERVGLAKAASTPLRQFSKGMLQRAGVAQALINEPELVILDEPMSGLDPVGRMLIRDLILELGGQGRTVFFSSHILSDVQSICHRVGLIAGGRLRAVGAVGELLSSTVAHMDCTVRVPIGVELAGELIAVHGEERILRIDPALLDPFIDAVRAAGGALLQVQPNRRNLEDLLVDEISRLEGGDAREKRA